MTDTKGERRTREGIPMSEEELREWKKAFSDIQESIDLVMGEGEDDRNGEETT